MSSPLELRIPGRVLAAVREHAAGAYPEECCGGLLGRDGAAGREVVRAVPVENERVVERRRRYLIDARTVLRLERRAADEGLLVIGFYHSHPDHPPEPSAYDRRHGWPWYTYLIVSVENGSPGAARSWRLEDGDGGVREEAIVLIPEAGR